MNVIKEKIINGKIVQLVLCDDNMTVKVIYDSICIDSSAEGTWNNIKDSGLLDAYLTVIAESYIDSIEGEKAFEEAWKELGW